MLSRFSSEASLWHRASSYEALWPKCCAAVRLHFCSEGDALDVWLLIRDVRGGCRASVCDSSCTKRTAQCRVEGSSRCLFLQVPGTSSKPRPPHLAHPSPLRTCSLSCQRRR